MIKKARTTILMQSQIENAMKMTRSNRAAAEYLRVSFNLYKKYAKLYKNVEGVSLFDAHKNQAGSGIPKTHVSQKRFQLDEILLGKYPQYPREKLMRRMLVNGYVEEKCNHCGFHQKRPTDLKVPLVIHHINGDKTDHNRDNLELLCYNCYFILVGNISTRDFKTNVYDRPEEAIPVEDILQSEEHAQALHSMDLLSDEEKQDLLRNLNNL